MADLKLNEPVTEEVALDADALEAIDRGLQDAAEGRLVSSGEVRRRLAEWNSRYSTPKPR